MSRRLTARLRLGHFATLSNQDCDTIFIDLIFEYTWTRPTFDPSEVKIDLYTSEASRRLGVNEMLMSIIIYYEYS